MSQEAVNLQGTHGIDGEHEPVVTSDQNGVNGDLEVIGQVATAVLGTNNTYIEHFHPSCRRCCVLNLPEM